MNERKKEKERKRKERKKTKKCVPNVKRKILF